MFVKFSKEYLKLFTKNININGLIQHINNLSFFKTLYYSPPSQHLERKTTSHIIFHEQPRVIEKFWDFTVLLQILCLAVYLRF